MRTIRILGMCAALAGWLCAAGCESDDLPDHEPPPGQGSLIVDNRTFYRLDVYLDGQKQGSVDDFDDRVFDLDPGVHRLVLEPDRDDMDAVAADVDLLEGRRTVAQADALGTLNDELVLSVYLD